MSSSEHMAKYTEALRAEIRAELLAALAGSLGGASTKASAESRAKARRKPGAKARRKPGEKRPPERLERVQRDILTLLQEVPSASAEDIQRALPLSLREIQLPIRKLLAEGKITKSGNKRATRYTSR